MTRASAGRHTEGRAAARFGRTMLRPHEKGRMGRRTVIAAAMLGLVALGTFALTRGDRAEAAAYSSAGHVDIASQDAGEAPAGEGPSGQTAAEQIYASADAT